MHNKKMAAEVDVTASPNRLKNVPNRSTLPVENTSRTRTRTAQPSDLVSRALAYIEAGLSIIPIGRGSKRTPQNFEWKDYLERQPTEEEVRRWVESYPGCGIGIVGGSVSGSLEILDLESIAPLEKFRQEVDRRAPGLLDRLPRTETPSGGRHVFYRCAAIEGNQKLAMRAVPVDSADVRESKAGKATIRKLARDLTIIHQNVKHHLEAGATVVQIDGLPFVVRTLIETRGEGGQVLSPLCPAGVHPAGGVYKLLNGDLKSIPTITSGERDILFSAARACNEHVGKARGDKEATREQIKGTNAGALKPGEDFNQRGDVRGLLERHGWSFFSKGNAGEQWARPGVDDHCSATLFPGNCLYVFSTNASPLEAGEAYSPFALLAELEYAGDYQRAAIALSEEGFGLQLKSRGAKGTSGSFVSSAEVIPENWPDPEPFPDGLHPVPALPEGLIPEPIRPWLLDIAERLQVPLEFPAVPAVVSLGAVVGNLVRVRPRRYDDWTVVPNLWGAIIGRPGTMKSPAIEQALKPIRFLIKQAEKAHEIALADWKFEKEAAEILRSAKKDEMKRAAKKGSDLQEFRADLVDDEIEEPHERRYIVNDTTVEKYGELLNQNPRGLLLFRDELTGWFRSLDDERRSNDRAFFLEAWNGDQSYTYDRIGRGTLKIENTTTSIIGGIQPSPLEAYLRGALGHGEGDDGLMQRFQLAVFPDLAKSWKNVDRWPDSEARKRALEVFQELDCVIPSQIGAESSDRGYFLKFSEEAQELFDEWYGELRQSLIRGKYELAALESHFAKYASLMPKLALIFHLCDVVEGNARGAIKLITAQRAAAWCEFLEAHAHRIYGLGAAGIAIHARTLARRLQKGELPDPFKARELYRKGWSGMSEPKDAGRVLDLLVDLKWLQCVELQTDGRPTAHYWVNPKIMGVKF